jgi:hypothetical protein
VMKLLFEKGADMESMDKYGQKLPPQAAASGRKNVVKLLLEKGTHPPQIFLLMGYWTCHNCYREVNRSAWGSACPDCGHSECPDCDVK